MPFIISLLKTLRADRRRISVRLTGANVMSVSEGFCVHFYHCCFEVYDPAGQLHTLITLPDTDLGNPYRGSGYYDDPMTFSIVQMREASSLSLGECAV